MRIATLEIDNQKLGGAYAIYRELIKKFLKLGWDVHHISPGTVEGIHHIHFTHHSVFRVSVGPYFPFFFFLSIIELLLIGMREKIDAIVVFSQLEAMPGVVFKLFHRNAKLVVAFHADSVDVINFSRRDNCVIRNISTPVVKIAEKVALKKADLIIFVSKATRDKITKRAGYNPENKIRIIYNSITPRMKELGRAEKVTLIGGTRTVGYVGALYLEGKGLNYLIQAFQKVKQELQDTILVILGDGPDRRVLAELAEHLNLKDDVIFIGYQENPLQYIKGFDILVLPSTHEAFGRVLLEAMSVGTLALGSNVGGIPEVLMFEELLFEPRDVNGLAMKITTLLKDERAYENARALCAQRKKAFDFDSLAEMFKVIEQAVQG